MRLIKDGLSFADAINELKKNYKLALSRPVYEDEDYKAYLGCYDYENKEEGEFFEFYIEDDGSMGCQEMRLFYADITANDWEVWKIEEK